MTLADQAGGSSRAVDFTRSRSCLFVFSCLDKVSASGFDNENAGMRGALMSYCMRPV